MAGLLLLEQRAEGHRPAMTLVFPFSKIQLCPLGDLTLSPVLYFLYISLVMTIMIMVIMIIMISQVPCQVLL